MPLSAAAFFWIAMATACTRREGPAPRDVETQTVAAALTTLPPGFREEVVFTGHSEPTAVRFTADGRVFVAEKQGRVWMYSSVDQVTSPNLVVDLRTQVHNFWDRGLLGLAIDPEFPSRPFLYVVYTLDANANNPIPPAWGSASVASDDCPNPPGATGNGCVVNAQLSRIEVDLQSRQGVEVPLLSGRWCQQFPSHSVGDLIFGESGALYVSAGDGANFNQADWGQLGGNPCGDPINEGGALRAQDSLSPEDENTFAGSVIRVDVSGSIARPAEGNPNLGDRPEEESYVVAMGLRNPFRMTTRPGTDELWIGDVGWTSVEELNVLDSLGEVTNFGWPCYEGNGMLGTYSATALCQRLYEGTPPGMRGVSPFFAYGHNSFVLETDGCGKGGSSITGVAFNSRPAYPTWYTDALFFADSTRRCIWSIPAGPDGAPDPAARTLFAKTTGRAVDLQQAPDGYLYYADFDGGNIYRYAYYPTNTPPVARITPSAFTGDLPLSASFDASGSFDEEDGDEITFAWDLDDDGAFDDGETSLASFVFDSPGLHRVWLRVTDSQQLTSTAVVTISAGNSAPRPEISSPLPDDRWAVGDVITLRGQATDPESGPIPSDALSWTVTMRHCDSDEQCHSHPITTLQGAVAAFTAPAHEYPSHLRIELSAEDTGGPGWDLPGWSRRLPLTVIGDYESEEALADVPVLVHLRPAVFDYAAAAPSGSDLRFVDEDGTLLSYEIEMWSPGAASAVWVKLPELTSASGRQLFVYYGNPEAEGPEDADVWSNDYVGVWHFADDLLDSVTKAPAVNHGAMVTSGPFGKGLSFDGTTSFVVLREALPLADDLTLEAWVHQGAIVRDNADNVLSTKTAWDAAEGFNLEVNFATSTIASLGAGRDFLKSGQVDFTADWHHVASVFNGDRGQLFLNGNDVTDDATVGRVRASDQQLHLGSEAKGEGFFMGDVDEVRLSAGVRSKAWLEAQYLAATDQLFRYEATEASARLTGSTVLEFYPKTSDITFQSEPPGLTLFVNGLASETPFLHTAISGSTLSVAAPAEQTSNGVLYTFAGWNDGSAENREIVADGDAATFVARFSCSPEAACQAQETGTSTASAEATCTGDCTYCTACESDATADSTPTQDSWSSETTTEPSMGSTDIRVTSTAFASTGYGSATPDSGTINTDETGVATTRQTGAQTSADSSLDDTVRSDETTENSTLGTAAPTATTRDSDTPNSSSSRATSNNSSSSAAHADLDAGGAALDAGATRPSPSPRSSSCGCRLGSNAPGRWGWAAVSLMVLCSYRRRRTSQTTATTP